MASVAMPAPQTLRSARRRRPHLADPALEGAWTRLRPLVAAAATAAAALSGAAQPAGRRVLVATAAYVVGAVVWERAPASVRRRGAAAAAVADGGVAGALVLVSGGAGSPLVALIPLLGLGVGLRFRPLVAGLLGAVPATALVVTAPMSTPPAAATPFLAAWGVAALLLVAAGAMLSTRWTRQRRTLQAAEQRARAAARRREDALRTVWHELRTPVASLSALVGAVCGPTPMSDQARRQALDLVARHAQHLSGLLDEVRTFAEAHQGHAEPAPADVWLPDVVEAAGAAAGLSDDHVDVRVPAAAGVVRVDPVRLRQILINLLDNARRHGSTTEPVVVAARVQGDWLRLCVANAPRAPGVPDDGGSGLGLAIVASLVDALGGRLCQRPWHDGVCVEVRLPLRSARRGHGLAPESV